MRRVDPFGRKATALSLAFHAALLALGWYSSRHRPNEFEFIAYEIELVSPPPAAQAEQPAPPREELVVERPQPEPPPEPEVIEEQVDVAEPEPEPEPPPPEPEPAPPPPEPEPEPEPDTDDAPASVVEPPPDATPDVSGEGINVRLEGLRRDYPLYYENIIRQIIRCFRWQGSGGWLTVVDFVIHRDGSVSNIEWAQRSGNSAFDLEAMGAVECAGNGRFGPLPADLPYDVLPVRFEFTPQGGGD